MKDKKQINTKLEIAPGFFPALKSYHKLCYSWKMILERYELIWFEVVVNCSVVVTSNKMKTKLNEQKIKVTKFFCPDFVFLFFSLCFLSLLVPFNTQFVYFWCFVVGCVAVVATMCDFPFWPSYFFCFSFFGKCTSTWSVLSYLLCHIICEVRLICYLYIWFPVDKSRSEYYWRTETKCFWGNNYCLIVSSIRAEILACHFEKKKK